MSNFRLVGLESLAVQACEYLNRLALISAIVSVPVPVTSNISTAFTFCYQLLRYYLTDSTCSRYYTSIDRNRHYPSHTAINMPAFPGTPEALLPRSDSKNPASTCRGLTSSGRPCRRALSPLPSPSPSPRQQTGSGAYCWQHRDQTPSPSPKRPQHNTIRERTSVDTLVDRLGILEVEERKKRRNDASNRPGFAEEYGRQERPTAGEGRREKYSTAPKPSRPSKPKPPPRSNLGLFCCIGIADDAKAPRPVKPAHPPSSSPKTSVIPQHVKQNAHHSSLQPNSHLQRPPIIRDPSSRTGEFLSLIPPSTSPQTTAQLLAELAKPISENDDEGYIYIFWLTPESLPAEPPAETASSLLAPPSRPDPGRRRTSDVLSTFSSTKPTSNKKTTLLKIGRAQNVHRRLNQWTKQCGHNLSLIRYYPYAPTGSSSPSTPRRVSCLHKVERLIHIELGAKRAQGSGKCEACGREHREWFEVEASKDGVRAVDEVVRRWVGWGEREG